MRENVMSQTTQAGQRQGLLKARLPLCLVIYLAFCLACLAIWQHRGINRVTGDEPHYLVITESLIKYGSLEVTQAYREEFTERTIYPSGLAPAGSTPDASNTHGIQGPNGLFSVHNIGLPLLLALPYWLGGVLGSKLFLLLLSSWAVVLAWKLARHFGLDGGTSIMAVLTLTVAMPLVPASNQIYPDLLAGLICLSGLYWLATPLQPRRPLSTLGYALAIAFLPWLQIKFSAAALLLVAAATWISARQHRNIALTLLWPLLFGLSITLLASYNLQAFGKVSGPYQAGALELSPTAMMVLLGLLLDQNQGMLLQNPMLLLGVLYLVPLLRRHPLLTCTWAMVFLAMLVPNALHPNWYGGGSFSGRFGWSAALCLFLPTLAALEPLRTLVGRRQLAFLLICLALLQGYFFMKYAWFGASLYNRSSELWLSAYTVLYGRVQNWLPALYNLDWAVSFAPNYLFAGLLPALVGYGTYLFQDKAGTRRLTPVRVLPVALLLIAVIGSLSQPNEQPMRFTAAALPSLTGQLDETGRQAVAQRDAPGFLSFGPYANLSRGLYSLSIEYQANAPADQEVATWDVYRPNASQPTVLATALHGSSGRVTTQKVEFRIDRSRPEPFEFRVAWPGTADVRLLSMTLKRLN
ncbi:hypothetical protein [Pseudomonas sp.]|uniref:hypothetical protein n=1 Tax=unclassified Pseudomonas TaxID=196821 RepID=UPI0031D1B857